MKGLRERSNYPKILIKKMNISKETFIKNDLYSIFNESDLSQLTDTSKIFITSDFQNSKGTIDSTYYEIHVPMLSKNKEEKQKYQYDFGFRKFEKSFQLVSIYTTP